MDWKMLAEIVAYRVNKSMFVSPAFVVSSLPPSLHKSLFEYIGSVNCCKVFAIVSEVKEKYKSMLYEIAERDNIALMDAGTEQTAKQFAELF